jgi:hypothetical protein
VLAPEETARPSEREANIARLVSAFEVLTQALTQAGVSASDLLSRCARAGQRMRAVIPLFDLT